MNNAESQAWPVITALLDEADACTAKGDLHGAAARYNAALQEGSRLNQWPAGMAERLAFARDACTEYSGNYARHLQVHMQAAGFDPQRASPRFTEALEIVLGHRQIHLQQPRLFYLPGLPQVGYFDNDQFPWLASLEQASEAIRAECMALLAEPGLFEALATAADGGTAGAPQVGICHLWKDGKAVPAVAQRCPESTRALAQAPLDHIVDRAPSACFLVLAPGARLPRGHGLLNTRLTVQLPLASGGQCGIRVGNTVREWLPGKAIVFDDSIEHEAWNDSPQACALLAFDVWRPELTTSEHELVAGLVTAIESFGATRLA
jgi:hypothetical protein